MSCIVEEIFMRWIVEKIIISSQILYYLYIYFFEGLTLLNNFLNSLKKNLFVSKYF